MGVLHPRWLATAPIAATLLLAIFSLMLWREDSRLRSKLEAAQAQLQEQTDKLQRVQAVVDLLNARNAVHMTLVSTPTVSPQPQARTIYVPQKGLLLMANNMESLPPDKVYQLWLLPADGKPPMSAGTFKPDARGNVVMHHPMREAIQAKAFAITIEPEGGSQTPTMPIRMISAG
jgi:hypothetical protein